MLYFNIREAFHACGITNVYGTLIKAGFSQRVAYNLSRNDASTIRLSHLETICRILNCTPNDLIHFKQNKTHPVSSTHALTQLQNDSLPHIREVLRDLTFEELVQLTKGLKKDKK